MKQLSFWAAEIHTTIHIQASPEDVWEVLTSFDTYPQWNPFITSIKGKLSAGSLLDICAGGMNFKPALLCVESNRELRWMGHFLFPGLFDGTHRFELVDQNGGATLLKHSERFKGLLVPVFKGKLLKETVAGFKAMNLALKKRVEQSR